MPGDKTRRLALLIPLVLAMSAAPARAAPAGVSRIVSADIAIASGSKAMRRINIYLPPDYDENAQGPGYPLLILLHGSPGSAGDWLSLGDAQATLDRLILAGKIPPLIASFPDGNGGLLRDTQFVNSADGKDPVEDFVSKVVPRYVWDHFRAARDPKRVAIGGLSSGGFGALNIGLKHQDVFGSIISFSGYGRIEQNAFSAPFIGGSADLIARNSPLGYISSLPSALSDVLLIIGKQDPLLEENQKLDAALKGRGIAVELVTFGGTHTWGFWRSHLEDGLVWLAERLRRD